MKRTVALLGLVAVFAGAAIAQSNSFRNQLAVNVVSSGSADDRPRIVDAPKPVAPVDTASVQRIAFQMLNQKRAEKGLKSLEWSDELETLAQRHSKDMAENKYFGHRGLDGSMVSDRADRCGIKRWSSIGENIAYNRGYAEPVEKAIKGWMESDSHRQNLLNDNWRQSAVGVAVGKDGAYYFTQVFLRK